MKYIYTKITVSTIPTVRKITDLIQNKMPLHKIYDGKAAYVVIQDELYDDTCNFNIICTEMKYRKNT